MSVFDAIVLAGGRSRRMGSPKLQLQLGGHSLLQRACQAVADARTVVVVGPPDLADVPAGALHVTEAPRFGGPAVAVGAGFDALAQSKRPAAWVAVVASDVPHARRVMHALGDALDAQGDACDGVIAVGSDGVPQPLLAIYAADALGLALRQCAPLENLGVKHVTSGLDLRAVQVPDAWLLDIDTPDDYAQASREWTHG